MSFSAIILAGGKSSRMGRDKAFLEIGGKTLLARQIRIVRAAGATEVFISGRPPKNYSAFGCEVLVDEFPGAGPLAGIHAGLRAAKNPLLLALAVDLPEMTHKVLRQLADETRAEAGAIPICGGNIEPLAAFYPCASLPLCETMIRKQNYAVRDFAADCVGSGMAKFVDLPVETGVCFANWNTPDAAGLRS